MSPDHPHGNMVYCNRYALIVDGPRSITFRHNADALAANDPYAAAGLVNRLKDFAGMNKGEK